MADRAEKVLQSPPKPKSKLNPFGWVSKTWHSLRFNPIILKELRHRMRGWHGMCDLAIYTFLLSIVGLLIYNGYTSRGRNYYSYYDTITQRSQEIGTTYFLALVTALLFLITVLAPSFSSGTISGEKERQTYDVLLVTLLKPGEIIAGKLFAALAYLLLVIIAAIPVISVAFLMGGVGLEEMIVAVTVLIGSCVTLGSISIFWSARKKTSKAAIRDSFWSTLLLNFGLPIGSILLVNLIRTGFTDLSFNIYSDRWWQDGISWICSLNPIYALLATVDILRYRADSTIFVFANNPGDFFLTPFARFLILSTLLTTVFLWLAIKNIKPINPESRKAKRETKKNKKQIKNETEPPVGAVA